MDGNGRFIKFPFKTKEFQLGDSLTQARTHFLALKCKLNKNASKHEYQIFNHKYQSKSHATNPRL